MTLSLSDVKSTLGKIGRDASSSGMPYLEGRHFTVHATESEL